MPLGQFRFNLMLPMRYKAPLMEVCGTFGSNRPAKSHMATYFYVCMCLLLCVRVSVNWCESVCVYVHYYCDSLPEWPRAYFLGLCIVFLAQTYLYAGEGAHKLCPNTPNAFPPTGTFADEMRERFLVCETSH